LIEIWLTRKVPSKVSISPAAPGPAIVRPEPDSAKTKSATFGQHRGAGQGGAAVATRKNRLLKKIPKKEERVTQMMCGPPSA
jgi:hypothetical protein